MGNILPQTVQTSHEDVMQTSGACLLLQYAPLGETVAAAVTQRSFACRLGVVRLKDKFRRAQVHDIAFLKGMLGL
jgi:hypothetical protein